MHEVRESPCCSLADLERFAAGELDADDSAVIASHLQRCPDCSGQLLQVSDNVHFIHRLRSGLAEAAGRHALVARGASAADELPGRIGAYVIVREIGRGGMGVVYEAQQQDPPRAVALKVLNHAHAADPLSARLLRREAQALARLNHPGIAAIFEAGCTASGQSFFVMELVDGEGLLAYAESRALSIAARLRLMLAVCQAVAFAHQRGVIHRDLKPSNILVNREGQPKVLDFGLAKVGENAGEAGGAAGDHRESEPAMSREAPLASLRGGTLPYMSPEQARGASDRIDVRSDVYALGVVMHELLTGALPYDINALDVLGAVRMIAEAPVRPPSETAACVDREVDAIVLKALAKEPEHRYESAAALRDDLRRYFACEPLAALPSTLRYRLRKAAARHKAAFALGGALALSVLAFAIVVTALAFRLESRRADAVEAQQHEAQARIEALRQAEIARPVIDFMADTLGAANPDLGGSRRDVRVVDVLRDAALAAASAFNHQPQVEAAVRYTLGNTYRALGETDQAIEQLEAAIAIQRRLREEGEAAEAGARAGASNELELAQSLNKLARVISEHGVEYQRAEALFNEALEIRSRLLGPEHVETAVIINNLGVLRYRTQAYDEAETLLRRAMDIRLAAHGDAHPEVATSLNNLALVLQQRGRSDEAEAMLRRSLEIDRAARGKDHPNVLMTMSNLAHRLAETQRFDEADELWRDVIDRQRTLLGEQHPAVAHVLGLRADGMRMRGNLAEAERLYRESLDAYAASIGREHPDAARVMHNLAATLAMQDDIDGAAKVYADALAALQQALGPTHPRALLTAASLGRIYIRGQRLDDAVNAVGGLVEALREADPPPDPSEGMAAALLVHGDALRGLKRYDEAERSLRQARDTFAQALGEQHPAVARTDGILAEVNEARVKERGE